MTYQIQIRKIRSLWEWQVIYNRPKGWFVFNSQGRKLTRRSAIKAAKRAAKKAITAEQAHRNTLWETIE